LAHRTQSKVDTKLLPKPGERTVLKLGARAAAPRQKYVRGWDLS